MLSLKKSHEKSLPLLSIVKNNNFKKPKTIWFTQLKYLDDIKDENGKLEEEELEFTNNNKLLKRAKEMGYNEIDYYNIRNYLKNMENSGEADELKKFVKENNKTEIKIQPDSAVYMNPINRFNKEERTVQFISGSSGSGKSTIASHNLTFLSEYYKNSAKNSKEKKEESLAKQIIIFSLKQANDDPAFDKPAFKNAIYVNTEKLMARETPLDHKQFKNKMVIFDDIDCINKPLAAKINDIQGKLLEINRSFKTDVIVVHHQTSNYKQTRQIMNEAKEIIIFPDTQTHQNLKYLLKDKLGMSKEMVKKVGRMDFCKIIKMHKIVIHNKGVELY